MTHWPFSTRDERVVFATPTGTVQAVVRHRAVRLRLGSARWEIGRLRVRSITPPGPSTHVRVPASPGPWRLAVAGLLLVWAGCAALLAARRWREQTRGAPRIPSS